MSNTPQIRFAGFTDAWEQRKLGDMMNVTSVKRIHQSDWTSSGVRFLRARDIVAAYKNEEPSDYLYISEEKYNEYSSLSGKVKIGDLLVTGVGTIGVPMLINSEKPLYFKDGNIIWFQNENKINGDFFYYSFIGNSIQNFIQESAGTGTVGTYTIDSGKKTPIALPKDITEQQQIGTYFRNLDNLITLHQRKCDALQKFKKSMLQKMFPQNGESVPEIRFAGFTDAWEQRKLSDLIEENQKPVPKPDGEYIRLGIRSHAKGTFHEVVAEGEGLDVDTMYVVEANNLIVNITFAWEEAWAITTEKDAEKLVSHRFPQYRFHHGQYPMFYQYRFRNGRMKYNLELASPGGAGRNRVLNKTEFMKIPVIIPTSYEEEKKIGDLFTNLDNLITLHQRKLETLQKMKKSLLQKMFV